VVTDHWPMPISCHRLSPVGQHNALGGDGNARQAELTPYPPKTCADHSFHHVPESMREPGQGGNIQLDETVYESEGD
jgi:hypothetical protein